MSTVIKEKDAEIAELRAKLEDKDKMLAALRTAARSRDNADRVDSRAGSRAEVRSSKMSELGSPTAETSAPSLARQVSHLRKRTKSVDEMSKMLDEMIQDRVETGQIVRGARGSVRVASDRRADSLVEPRYEPLRHSPSPAPVAMEV